MVDVSVSSVISLKPVEVTHGDVSVSSLLSQKPAEVTHGDVSVSSLISLKPVEVINGRCKCVIITQSKTCGSDKWSM